MADQHNQPESDFPTELSRPALQALEVAGYTHLEQLTSLSEAEVLKWHGMGPKGVDMLRRALHARGLSFAEKKKTSKS